MIWHYIVDSKDALLVDVFQLYDQIFPLEVREPHDVLVKSLQTSQLDDTQSFGFLVGRDQDTVVSFATAHYFTKVNSGFIVYIGTDPSYRNHGIGSQTLAKMEKWFQENARKSGFKSLRAVILEVEKIENMTTELERVECIKRNHFFEKNGYDHVSSLHYVQPPLHAYDSAVPLNLFVKVVHGGELEKRELFDLIDSMYTGKYRLINQIPNTVLHECLQSMGISVEKPRVY